VNLATATSTVIPVTAPAAATITASGTLTALTTTVGAASATTSFTVSGFNLPLAGILVAPPAGFEVSASATTGFGATITVGAAGTVAPTTVYVRLAAATAVGSYSGNIVLSSAGAANVTIATATSTVTDAVAPEIIVHQAVSPNGDGKNDVLEIEGIESYPDNTVILVNRNAVKIYQTTGYDNTTRAFDGHSNITGALQQPGTYFYLVEYTVNGQRKRKTGFFVLKYE
jgi:gliding motility-associated-like protein